MRVEEGAKLENCIIMRGCVVEKNVRMANVIADKDCIFSENTMLIGSAKLPTVVPKGKQL